MQRSVVQLFGAIVATAVLVAGCAQSAPAPTAAPKAPAAAPAAPTAASAPKPAEPTKPAAAAAPKVTYPEKNKTITAIVPFAAGGGTDIAARAVSPIMEKELGTAIQILNKPGAATQMGLTDIAQAKPDGYTIGVIALPTGLITYLDPERKAVYTRKSFQTVGMISADPIGFNVVKNSPLKTMKDVADALKAKPESLKASTTGIGSVTHLGGLYFEQQAGVKMSYVHFDSTPLSLSAMMGGHVDIMISGISGLYSQYKSGEARQIAVMDTKPNPLAPDVPTFESQGYKVYAESNFGIVVPTGTPKEVIDRLEGAFQKAMADDGVKKTLLNAGQTPRGLNAAQYQKAWDDMEGWVKPLMSKIKQ